MSEGLNLGLEGEECDTCRAPLAADQRYCLNCGRRRGATRVDLEALGAAGTAQMATASGPAVAPVAAVPQQPAAWTPMTIVGGIAMLAVVLLVGVMLGKDGQDPVQVSAVPTAAPVAAATTTAEPTGDKVASTGSTDTKKSGGGSKDFGGSKDKVVPAESTPGAETLSDDQLNALDQASGDDYAKQSKNLPDTIALPGEPPPKDNGEPGAGTPAQVIK